MKNIKILLVDDHQVIRDGIKAFLEYEDGIEIIGEALNGKAALKCLEETPEINLVFTDITMPVMDGITLTKEIKKAYPNMPVIALTMLTNNTTIKKMLNAGVSGYILKSSGKEEVLKAINAVTSGGVNYYSPEVSQIVMENMMKKKSKNSIVYGIEVKLSEREIGILQLIVDELSNKEIAEKLFISQRTVDAHKRNLLEKTGSKNIVGLVKYAINYNLIEI